MTRLVIDSFMVNDELNMLQCRLEELGDTVDYFVAVEADVDHQDHPKPFHLTENLGRFSQWADKLIVVQAKGLPTIDEAPDPWARELGQREHVWTGLEQIGAGPNDVILHGDIDEIPTAVAARNIRPRGFLALGQRAHFWSCRWLYPPGWQGTVATTVGHLSMMRERLREKYEPRAQYEGAFASMRNARNAAPCLPDAGWHLSWLGGADRAMQKVGSFCHPEVEERIVAGLASDKFLQEGVHVDGVQMVRCEVDSTFPRYVFEGRCPPSWLL